ncbi:MAG: DUF1285 domain-containing protein [Pseudomonadales bacterium]|jgi:hypothetical protein|tara:strand:+ start:5524 stop:6054 length:531 start_codon:yes stop_codon:yes gene_type:complete
MSDIDDLFETLTNLQTQKRLPPVHLWQPERVGEIDIRIDREGHWYHEGTRIKRQPLVDLFATILRKDGDTFYLVTPVEQMAIVVEEAPFLAIDLDIRGAGESKELLFTTNVGDFVVAGEEHPVYMVNERPFIEIRNGLVARIQRSVFYRLVEEGVEEEGALLVYSQGARFDLGSIS